MPFESCPYFSKINEFVSDEGAYFWLLSFADLAPPEQALIAIWELEQEVYNGGFLQYFQNSSGDRVPFICEILRSVGAHQIAPIVQRAIDLAGPYASWDDQIKRYPMLAALSDETKSQLSDLDAEFYGRLDELNLLVFRYLQKHEEQIGTPKGFWREETKQ